MSQPTPYTRQTDFSEDERANVGGRSTVRTDKLDAELDALGTTANESAKNLGLIQRDDGALRDRVVTPESLSQATTLMIGGNGFRPRGRYAAGQSYQIRDMVEVEAGVYVCIEAVPTAADFNTERAAGKWQAFSASNNQALTAAGLPFGPVAGIAATNAQAAIVETHDLAAEAKTKAEQALAGAGTGGPGGSDSTAIPPFAVAALVAAATAANRVNAEIRDPTLPPKAPTPGLTAGVGQIEATWVKATYTQGHGPGRVLVWAAEWPTDTTAPDFGTAKALGGVLEGANRTAITWNPLKKVRVWLAFESFDGYQGPVSDPADVTTIPIPASALGQLQLDANMLAAAMETGALVNDPHFAGGAARWNNFLQRQGGASSTVPAGCPVEFAAQFKGRDCTDARSYSVRAGDQYVLDIFAHNGTTGLPVGVVAYFEYSDGRAMTSQTVVKTPTPNTWTQVDGPITIPPGAVRMHIGPHITQAHTGTQTCWFGYIRAIKISEGDEIRQGSLTAINIAARSITTNELVVGAATDAVSAAKVTTSIEIPTGANFGRTPAGPIGNYLLVPFSRPIKRGLLVVDLELQNFLSSTNIAALKFFDITLSWGLIKTDGTLAGTSVLVNADGSNINGGIDGPPFGYRLAIPTRAESRLKHNFSAFVDLPAASAATLVLDVTFAALTTAAGMPRWQVQSNESANCIVIASATFVENKV
jgi:hypothetical protein